ncbi:MAG TPA: efflux transporter outer membrane subunit [Candidatus Binatia bacterium]|nr:efflux transporter outer membrane subunit [Candidatus Binatia bacterium]
MRSRVVLVGVVLAGCAVGPDYRTPEMAVPDRWGEPTAAAPEHATDLATWWRAFGDPMLDELVDAALAQNLTLAESIARIREARARRVIATSGLFPHLGTSAEYQYTRPFSENSQFGTFLGASGDAAAAASLFTTDLYQASFDASWELDVFGGIRRGIEAADADVAAAEDAARATQVTLLAEVARTYVAVRSLQRRLAITAENLESQRTSVELTQSRFDSGLASELDVRQARSLLATTEAEVPDLERQREQAVHALSVLLAREPNALRDRLAPNEPIPGAAGPDALAVRIPMGLPSDLLRRRPDVRRAERQVAAATARIGVATAELFPKISLTGFAGLQSISASDFFTSGSRYFGAGPTISWRVFEGGRLHAAVEAQEAATQQMLYRYEQTVLTSLRDVEDALVAYAKERRRRDALADAVGQNQRSVVLSRDLYVHGLGTYLAVLDAQRAEYATEDSLVQSDQAVVEALISTYKALGGGWEPTVEMARE